MRMLRLWMAASLFTLPERIAWMVMSATAAASWAYSNELLSMTLQVNIRFLMWSGMRLLASSEK